MANRSRSRFLLITGTGHCGTKWLSSVLHRPDDGIVCYHEEKLNRVPLDWKDSLLHEFESGIDGLFDDYFSFIGEQLECHPVVADSNSWTMIMLPRVARRQKVDRIIYLVRNGIQTVHSMFYHNLDIPEDDFLYTGFFRRYRQVLGYESLSWAESLRWEAWCFWWRVNLEMPTWLRREMKATEVDVYRFEDLCRNVHSTVDLIRGLNPQCEISEEEVARLQRMDVNRKIEGDRSPQGLWSRWTEEQRAVFQHTCGPAMEHYGYPFPGTT